MTEDPRFHINRHDKAAQRTLIAHGVVALAGIIPAFAAFLLSQDQCVHATGIVATGTIEAGNLLQLRSNMRRSQIL